MLSSDIFRFHAVNEKDPTGVKQFMRNEEESKTAESKIEQTGEFELKFQKLNPSRHFCCLYCSFTVDTNKRQQNFNEILGLYLYVYVCVPISTSSKGAIVVKSIIRLASEINGLFIRTFSRLYGNKQIQMAIKTTKQMPKKRPKTR